MWYFGTAIPDEPKEVNSRPTWRSSEDVCGLADDERHLGHVVRAGEWHAYDATKPDETQNGFRHLGSFASIAEAKRTVESSVMERASDTWQENRPLRYRHAASATG